ncbi:kelch-like protein 25 [Arctopsyche grandis]|uniref:kelch-like protein 25 n=1 Tax=Arctopsyche grandis TaxID=121162 RepID=UPI00406D6637
MNDSDHQTQMLHGFNHMQYMSTFFTSGTYYDIELIIIGDKRYKTHKSILHAASPLFRTKLNQNIRELVMNCEGIRDESIAKAFEFIYKGTVELRLEQVANILKLADMWQMDGLKKYCYSYLEIVCQDNRQVYQKNEEIDDYLLDNFLRITKHEKFLNMSADNVKRLLSSDDLQVSSEGQVFEGLSHWVKHDWTNRKNDLYSLMKCVRYPLCSISFLLEEVASLCCESVEGYQLLLDALKWHEIPQKRSTLSLMNSKSRKKNKQVLIIGRKNIGMSVGIKAYNLRTKSWTVYHKMDIRSTDFSTAMFKNNVFVFGGWNFVDRSHNRVYSFDLLTGALKNLAPMKVKRSLSTAVVVNGRIFVIGGYNQENILDTVEEYDYVKNSWIKVASMKRKRHCHASVVYKEDIYVFGGENEDEYLNSVEVFNTKKNQWKILRPMKWKRSSFAAVVVEDYIYCIGGNDSPIDNVERYDPESDTWTVAGNSLVKDFNQVAICHDRKIICFAGYWNTTVQEYDPANDQWKIISQMPNNRNHYTAHVVDLCL